jgi:diguanylate cyclase (GGDEF)-like protein
MQDNFAVAPRRLGFRMPWTRWSREVAVFAGLAAAYFVAGKLGLQLAVVHPNATPIWAPTGLTIAAFLLVGTRCWPAIFLGAFLVNMTTQGTVLTSLGIASGNTLEGVLAAHFVRTYAGGLHLFDRPKNVFRFAVLAAGVSTTLSATIGVTTLALGGFAGWEQYTSIWITWWLGDVTGALVFAPAFILWGERPRVWRGAGQALEAVALLLGLALTGVVVFGGVLPGFGTNYPLEFLCIPFLLWAAFRFGARAAATTVLLLSAIAIWGTLQGFGPFVNGNPNKSLLLLQAFMGVASIMSLILAAAVSERRLVEAQLRQLSASDPLTGLANYRQLLSALHGEMVRVGRTEKPFALMLLDVDQLKKINDTMGHLTGSRALCRVAEVLHASCRAVDTAARFGGDEFALVLPEASEAAAWQVAQRVVERLATDPEEPAITVSIGVAIYPRDGDTVESLLNRADKALYGMKARGGGAVGLPPHAA